VQDSIDTSDILQAISLQNRLFQRRCCIESVDYSYDSLLIAAYGAEQGAEYLKLVDEYSLSEQEGYDFRQSKR
jgi:hypothetical protein